MQRVKVSSSTTIPHTVGWISKLALEASKDKRIQKIAQDCMQGVNELECVFEKVYNLLVYKPTPDEEQQLRTVENMFREGVGNCANYATLISSILQNMGVKHSLRTVGYTGKNDYEHIYVVADDGTVLDPVLGQKQDGTETRYKRPQKGKFNKEVDYKYKHDYTIMPGLSVLNGCGNNIIPNRTNPAIPAQVLASLDRFNSLTRSKAVRFNVLKQRKPLGCTDCGGKCGK